MSFQVQFITHFTETLSYLDSVRIALEGSCRWIQLRMKDAPEDEVRAAAGKALPLCRQYGAAMTAWNWYVSAERTASIWD